MTEALKQFDDTATDICGRYPLKAELQPLLADSASPEAFLDRLLLDDRHVSDALDFLAYGLPDREVVWWGCLAIQLAAEDKPLPMKEQLALRAAVRWVFKPGEETRRAAQLPGEEAGPASPAGCLATAVFESGGSILPPGQPAVEPPPTATSLGVRNALQLLAALGPAPQRLNQIVALGIGVGRRFVETFEAKAAS